MKGSTEACLNYLFARTKIFYSWMGNVNEAFAMISREGIHKLVDFKKPISRNEYRILLETPSFFVMDFHPSPFEGRYKRELNSSGSTLDVVFQNLNLNQKKALGQYIKTNGEKPTWRRKSRRFIPQEFGIGHEVPVAAVIQGQNAESRLRLMDFNSEGLLLENPMPGNGSDFIPKDIVRITLYTNNGRVIKNLLGKIVRTSELTVQNELQPEHNVQHLGFETINDDSESQRTYNLMIDELKNSSPVSFDLLEKKSA